MTTNELKKGTRIRLRNGWFGTLEDNMRGNIRIATVEGIYKEMGSIYSHNIVGYCLKDTWQYDIVYTKAQLKMQKSGYYV